jgi:predicted AlkP superfamily phosphohydrolase/phosphomutase
MAYVDDSGLGKPKITSAQKGETFWDILSESGIRSKIIKVPISFPAKELNGSILTGLGTPDALGTMGTFGFYTTEDTDYRDNNQAYNLVRLPNEKEISTSIKGPKNKDTKLVIKREEGAANLKIGSKDVRLAVGKWSDYVEIDFNLLGPLYKNHGLGRFYLQSVQPNLNLYLSPISFDPTNPLYEISYPKDFSKTLANEIGNYKTLGWSIDTWGLKEERTTEEMFLDDLNSTFDEELRIMRNELPKNDWDTYVQVFQATDFVQHMFFRYLDPSNPRYADDPHYKQAILEVYKRADATVGEVMADLPKDATLIVMSDHGFSSYNKSVDLNAWLVEKGYLTLKDPSKRSDYLKNVYTGEDFWDNVDWSRTKAYALGLGSIYINLEGREGQGIVSDEEYVVLRNKIKEELLALRDGSIRVISNVYKSEEVMHGPYLSDAADLIVGFNKNYRVSWQTTFGSVPEKVIFPNDNKWSGDHCSIDPKLIPGVFLSNKKYKTESIGIMDIAPTILNIFGIEPPADMDGQTIL